MDARRFDALARALTAGGSRRRLLRGGLAGLVGASAAGLTPNPRATVRADAVAGDQTGVGGTEETCPDVCPDGTTCASDADCARGQRCFGGVCVPRPLLAELEVEPEELRPARIIAGTCANLEATTAFPLFDVGTNQVADDVERAGARSAVPVQMSATTVRSALADLLDERHAIVVAASADDDTTIACGDIGGLVMGNDLALGLQERNGSGASGVAWLRGDGDATLVYLFVGLGLSGAAAGVAAGDSVVVVGADVNLRAEPTTDGEVVAVIPEGTVLTVSGPADSGWIPVTVPESGERGYVAAQYLAAVG